MGIAVRIWTEDELKKVKEGDKWLTTILANSGTFTTRMIEALPSDTIKRYCALWDGDDVPATLFATDDEMVLKFIEADFNCLPSELTEVITTYREIISSNPSDPKV